tara:strand:- start:6 stop:590 length:585 start_codon:yes stop_codon:yes gene_type:complete
MNKGEKSNGPYSLWVFNSTDDSMSQAPDITISQDPKYVGGIEIRGWSCYDWHMLANHEPVKYSKPEAEDSFLTGLTARKDSPSEYHWWYDAFDNKIEEMVKNGEIRVGTNEKKYPGPKYANLLIKSIIGEWMPLHWWKYDGGDRAYWAYHTKLKQILALEKAISKEEWADSTLLLHNTIIDELRPEWDKVKPLL